MSKDDEEVVKSIMKNRQTNVTAVKEMNFIKKKPDEIVEVAGTKYRVQADGWRRVS